MADIKSKVLASRESPSCELVMWGSWRDRIRCNGILTENLVPAIKTHKSMFIMIWMRRHDIYNFDILIMDEIAIGFMRFNGIWTLVFADECASSVSRMWRGNSRDPCLVVPIPRVFGPTSRSFVNVFAMLSVTRMPHRMMWGEDVSLIQSWTMVGGREVDDLDEKVARSHETTREFGVPRRTSPFGCLCPPLF